jgi:hypothetical protein
LFAITHGGDVQKEQMKRLGMSRKYYIRATQERKSQSEINQRGDRETCTQSIRYSPQGQQSAGEGRRNARPDDHHDELAAFEQRQIVQLRASHGVPLQGRHACTDHILLTTHKPWLLL